MIDHASDIIPLLLWIIVIVGAALVALILWVSKRLQNQVDAMPEKVTRQVQELHTSILERMDDITNTHRALERDIRASLTDLDRRLVRVEVRCDMTHGGTA